MHKQEIKIDDDIVHITFPDGSSVLMPTYALHEMIKNYVGNLPAFCFKSPEKLKGLSKQKA